MADRQEICRIFPCVNCEAEYENAATTRKHMKEKEKLEVPEVSAGKRYQEYKYVKNSDTVKYGCCLCFELSSSKELFRAHYYYRHEPADENAEEQVSHPFSRPFAPLIPVENQSYQPAKRKKSSYEATSHLLGKENKSTDIFSALVDASKLTTNYISISMEEETEDMYFVSSPKELLKVNKFENKLVKVEAGTCIRDKNIIQPLITRQLPDDYLHQTLLQSQIYAWLIKLDAYSEVTKDERELLNRDWLFGEELRLGCAQLLAGSILVEGEQILFINTVEVYSRSSSLDVHHERLDPVVNFSSVPTPACLYGNISVLQYNNDNSIKLIIGTYSFNALITSSVRIDLPFDLETGPSTRHFTPSLNTKLFIADSSRTATNDIIVNRKAELYGFDMLHQLRQLRSKLTSPSTYTISRACAMLTNQVGCRPYTVFTISDIGTNTTYTDEILGSMILRLIAMKVLKKLPTITKEEVENILNLKQGDTSVLKIIKSIHLLFKENNTITILHNQELETLLNTLASTITTKLPLLNEQVKPKFKQRVELLNKPYKPILL